MKSLPAVVMPFQIPWTPQRGQNSGALRFLRCTVAKHADSTVVASLDVQVFCRLAMTEASQSAAALRTGDRGWFLPKMRLH
jgi:hypothetical protein